MNYASVCSGIEAPTVAWEPLGWKAAWFSEIEPFPCAVLQHHYPHVPNLGDMTKIHERTEFNDSAIDVLIGGTPCQSFSVAGLRKGLADPRGNLALVFLGLVDRARPSWVVWENVPGVLSSSGGRDFGAFLGGLAELGYGFAYRVLDAQYAGVPQRRRRVFVVGYLGDWRPAAAVLFERHSLSGDTPPSRKKGERVAGTIKGGSGSRGYPDPSDGNGGMMVECFENHAQDSRVKNCGDLSPQLNAKAGTGGNNLPLVMAHGQGNAEIRRDGSPSLTCNHEAPIVAFTQNTRDEVRDLRDCAGALGANEGMKQRTYLAIRTAQTSANGHGIAENVAHTLDGTQGQAVVNSTVRRLTPRECERLQGLPDDYTLIPFRGKPAADGPRYKALGNSMAVPVIRWIGKRIEAVYKEPNP